MRQGSYSSSIFALFCPDNLNVATWKPSELSGKSRRWCLERFSRSFPEIILVAWFCFIHFALHIIPQPKITWCEVMWSPNPQVFKSFVEPNISMSKWRTSKVKEQIEHLYFYQPSSFFAKNILRFFSKKVFFDTVFIHEFRLKQYTFDPPWFHNFWKWFQMLEKGWFRNLSLSIAA